MELSKWLQSYYKYSYIKKPYSVSLFCIHLLILAENDRLFEQTVQDNPIMKAIGCQIQERRPGFEFQPHLVGSLRVRYPFAL